MWDELEEFDVDWNWEQELAEADAESYYADMMNMPSEQPTMEELADMSQRFENEIPF